jgi:hypothetical protein
MKGGAFENKNDSSGVGCQELAERVECLEKRRCDLG